MQITEHTFARQMAKAFDFIGLNIELIKTIKNDAIEMIVTHDASFIAKSGKQTYGLDNFWNGCASKVEKGLEIDVIAAIKITGKKDGFTISAEQTPASSTSKPEKKKGKKKKKKKEKKKVTDASKIDLFLNHVKKVISEILKLGIKYMVADAFFAKEKYVNGIVSLGLHVVSKLRKDARLKRPYNGPQKARGRKKKFDMGKVCDKDFETSPVVLVPNTKIQLRSCIAYSVSLGRMIKVVWGLKQINDTEYEEAFLFSTDLELDMLKIYELYVSRFQIEFIFRDAKNFTGLNDCQSRNAQRLHYHFNASLTALNVAKIQDAELQKDTDTQRPFSMASWARKYHVDIVINQFIEMFGLDLTLIKLHPSYNKFLSFGEINY